MKTYSQLGQDLDVLKFLNNKKGGYFVDIGANDGVNLSNTFLLEQDFEWTGICADPNTSIFNELVKNRPNSICDSRAVYSTSDLDITFSQTNDSLYSGITVYITVHTNHLVNSNSINVKTVSLFDLLKQHNAPKYIDYMSMDTEGSELDILQSFPFDQFHFRILHIEHNYVEPNRSKIKDLLEQNNYQYIGENKWDDIFVYIEPSTDFCRFFLDSTINNIKGDSYKDRFTDVLSDPNNLLIPRHVKAGLIEDDYIYCHNGIPVLNRGYYGDFSEILQKNKGCHEPAEERMFQQILSRINPNALMIELGSYWSFYSIWFQTQIQGARNICIEAESENLNIGKINCQKNNVQAEFIQGFIGNSHIRVSNIVKERKIDFIDLLHSDIQGFELEMLQDIVPLLLEKKVGYLFISTHSDSLHVNCIQLLESCKYKIIASADFETETFCYDGIIVATFESNPIEYTYLGCRKHTKLIQ